jgi:HEAT repeat protein
MNGPTPATTFQTEMEEWLQELESRAGPDRERARRALIALGSPAVPALCQALRHSDEKVRWEAAKALGELGDPAAAPALVETLSDPSFAVHWLAARALVALREDALLPLLHVLASGSGPDRLWAGAHHVIGAFPKAVRTPELERLLQTLDGPEPEIEAPQAALLALRALTPAR